MRQFSLNKKLFNVIRAHIDRISSKIRDFFADNFELKYVLFGLPSFFFVALVVISAVSAAVPNSQNNQTKEPQRVTAPSIGEINPSDPMNPNRLLFGLYTTDPNPEIYDKSLGVKMDLMAWFSHWGENLGNNKLKKACSEGYLPIITWESRPKVLDTSDTQEYSLNDIAEGKYDDLIINNLKQVKAICQDQDVVIRFDHEMDTTPGVVGWYPWQGDPAAYIASWKHVVSLGRSIDPHIKWLWAVNAGTNDSLLYYPGKESVDYVGVTLNHRSSLDDFASFEAMYDFSKQIIESFHKPIIVAETTSAEGLTDKSIWVNEMFKYAESNHRIVAIAWFNGGVLAYEYNSSPESQKAFWYSVNVLHDKRGF